MATRKNPVGIVVATSNAHLVRQVAFERNLKYEEVAVQGHPDAVRFRFDPMDEGRSRELAFAIPSDAHYFQGVFIGNSDPRDLL